MRLQFTKYHGTGNDFIMIDGTQAKISLAIEDISYLCDRHFGIGADGLIIIEPHASLDFNMNYYNSDGSQSFCGNGSRCAVHYAHSLGIVRTMYRFTAIDGEHEARFDPVANRIEVKMRDAGMPEERSADYFAHTGSPHYIRYVAELDSYDVVTEGRAIRYSEPWQAEGTNVNFVEKLDDTILKVRTYERGVEDETLSCGTGVTAVAITDAWLHGGDERKLITPGGELEVYFQRKNDNKGFEDIWLCGEAQPVFSGSIELANDTHS